MANCRFTCNKHASHRPASGAGRWRCGLAIGCWRSCWIDGPAVVGVVGVSARQSVILSFDSLRMHQSVVVVSILVGPSLPYKRCRRNG
jgi:hypothetical protein